MVVSGKGERSLGLKKYISIGMKSAGVVARPRAALSGDVRALKASQSGAWGGGLAEVGR